LLGDSLNHEELSYTSTMILVEADRYSWSWRSRNLSDSPVRNSGFRFPAFE